MNTPHDRLRRKNIRLAWLCGVFALLIFITSFPFWQNIFKALGSVTK